MQKQCEHDSCAIGFRILDLAKQITSNPTMELDNKIPPHAQIELKKNASTRYVQFAKEINELHTKYDDFLKHSELEKSSTSLLGSDAKVYEANHKATWDHLLESYKEINLSSNLFTADHVWYKVGLNTQISSPERAQSSRNRLLFNGVAIVSCCLLISSLIFYFINLPDAHSLQSGLKFE